MLYGLNSSWPSDTIMMGDILVNIGSGNALMSTYCLNQCRLVINWTIGTNLSEIQIKIHFLWRKQIWKCYLQADDLISTSLLLWDPIVPFLFVGWFKKKNDKSVMLTASTSITLCWGLSHWHPVSHDQPTVNNQCFSYQNPLKNTDTFTLQYIFSYLCSWWSE